MQRFFLAVIADFKAMPKWKRVAFSLYGLVVAALVLPGAWMIATGNISTTEEVSTQVEIIEVPPE